jgi:glutamate synthase domain-containing protein 2
MCKQSKNAPYCDGTDATLKEEADTSEAPAPASNGSTTEKPALAYIKALAKDGLSKTEHYGEMGIMGVPIAELPPWKDIQLLAAQMTTKPLMEDVAVNSELIIGPNAKKPLKLDILLFVSDMNFGALSEEAKISLSKGAQLAGTGICFNEGRMLDEEQKPTLNTFTNTLLQNLVLNGKS